MTALTSKHTHTHTHTPHTHSITGVTHGNSHWCKSCDTAEKVTTLPRFVRFATERFWASLSRRSRLGRKSLTSTGLCAGPESCQRPAGL